MTPKISVIICTYGRAVALEALLKCLAAQEYPDCETLVIDGNGDVSPAREALEKFQESSRSPLSLRLIKSPKGLTRQRNVGLAEVRGDLICFLDDDVTFESDFLARAASIFAQPEARDVGGITGYDALNYAAPVTLRWRLRKLLGTIPSLDPGATDRLGRAVTVSFLKPLNGSKQIGWLPGFCMIFRREAVDGLRFDEILPTYGGEDREFSMRVAQKWKLSLCGDLLIKHHGAAQGRDSQLGRVYQTGFGTGRRFAKTVSSLADVSTMVRTMFGDSLIDILTFWGQPSYPTFMTVFVRNKGFAAGWFSYDRRMSGIDTQNMSMDREERQTVSAK
jgi:glycosyltransferase involved in cell wall biosynthesis